MDDAKEIPKAKPRGVSLYDAQWKHAEKVAQELTKQKGKKVYASEVIQQLIEADMERKSRDKFKNGTK